MMLLFALPERQSSAHALHLQWPRMNTSKHETVSRKLLELRFAFPC